MKNLLLMRAPLKYIQGANALKHFYENIKEFGNNYLFICSNSAYKSTHDLIEESFKDSKTKRIYQIFILKRKEFIKFLAEFLQSVKLIR